MTKSSSNARAVDTTLMKKLVADCAPLDRKNLPLKPALIEDNKSDRGFSHPMIARLLCPQKYLAEFDAHPG